VSVSFGVALIGLAKLLLLVCALIVLIWQWLHPDTRAPQLRGGASPMILLALACLAVGTLWSTGSTEETLLALVKHGKLLLIPVLLSLMRSRREALIALACFGGAQVFLLASTWLHYAGVPIAWITSKELGTCDTCSYAIFSSYLDQSIMTAVLAAVAWHCRSYLPGRWRTLLAPAIALLALACVFLIFQGRTAYLIAVALIAMTIAWELPRRLQLGAALLLMALLAALVMTSSQVRQRVLEIDNGIQSYQKSGTPSSSSGNRIFLWLGSLRLIEANPLHGTGTGSWKKEFKEHERSSAKQTPAQRAADAGHQNPHQEFLLWGVELGLPGVALFCAVLLALYRDSRRLETPARRALQSVLAALILACLFNCALYDALIGDFFCMALALLAALRAEATPLASAAPSPQTSV
jgi:O-antigen ligase